MTHRTAFTTIPIAIIIMVVFASIPAAAGTISLAWDPVGDEDLAGYRVYYGTSPGNYTQNVDVGNVVSYTLDGLADCTTWYVAVKAYDTEGLESEEYSNQVSGWPRPVLTSATPREGERGSRLAVTITGNNFMEGATVAFSAAGIAVDSVTRNSCTELVAAITISSIADLGPGDIETVNPDDVFGTGAGLFTVLEEAIAPTITSQPGNATVYEGRTATFQVSVEGDAPLSYQWYENGTAISGATSDNYTTPPATTADDGDIFTCTVTNPAGEADSDPATLTVRENGTRVTDGLLSLYTFEEGTGSTVNDVGNVDTPLDLTVATPSAVSWGQGSMSVDSSTIIDSGVAATKVISAVRASREITVEAWIASSSLAQGGPARIVTISGGDASRNMTMGQDGDVYELRFRASSKSEDGLPALFSPAGDVATGLSHLAFTRDTEGAERLFVDGVERSSQSATGNLNNWDNGYHLALANEFNAGRPWLGEYHLVALFQRALTATEIEQNYLAGPDGDNPPQNQAPTASFTMTPAAGDAPLTVNFNGSGSSDPDGTIVSYEWDFGDGSSGTGVTTSHAYVTAGNYTVTLVVVDDDSAEDSVSDTVSVTEPVFPPTVTSHPQNATVDEGNTATFTVSATGTAPLAYQWRRNGADIAGAVSSSYTTPPTAMSDDGSTYHCIVSNTAGSDTSDTAVLTVLDATAPSVASTNPADGQTGVSRTFHPIVNFSEAMNAGTITVNSVTLLGPDGQPVPQAAGSPSLSGSVVTIIPAQQFEYGTVYRIRVTGGAGGVEDLAGNPMEQTYSHGTGFTVEQNPNQPPVQVQNLRREDRKVR